MKKVPKKEKKKTENENMVLEEQQKYSFRVKQNIQLEKENQELSPIALMRHRIEEMNRILLEKRNQRKFQKKLRE